MERTSNLEGYYTNLNNYQNIPNHFPSLKFFIKSEFSGQFGKKGYFYKHFDSFNIFLTKKSSPNFISE